jgi:hypothetical protein
VEHSLSVSDEGHCRMSRGGGYTKASSSRGDDVASQDTPKGPGCDEQCQMLYSYALRKRLGRRLCKVYSRIREQR